MKATKKISVVLAVYNEEAILKNSLKVIYDYISGINKYDWEVIIVNDGSKDNSGNIADQFAKNKKNVKVFHHLLNLNLGNALKTGFSNSTGDFVVTFDIDLSYSTDHIEKLLDTIEITQADIVLASPYM